MKTVVVISALVSLAIAAPSLSGVGLETADHTQDWHLQTPSGLPDALNRERKSPSEISTSSTLNNGASNSEVQVVEAGVSTPMARSFTLKKPLIVKKKYGYQLYRDSEEEKANAESNELCGRQVRVKLCNEDDKLRASGTGVTHMSSDIHTTEEDVKHSIKMAKEAIENLQRDLKKMEPKTDMKMADESPADIELHEDIEVARQALKHIHDNFGNLESMSLHATATRNTEDMHNMHLTIAKTEEERMAQWKEAMETIKKNVELVGNIEDSFKVSGNHESTLEHLDQSEAASTITDKKAEDNIHINAALPEINHLPLAKDEDMETHHQEKKAAEEMIQNKATDEHLNEHIAKMEQHLEDDMSTAPSDMIEIHLDNTKKEALRSESHKIHEHEKSAEVKLEDHKTETMDLENQFRNTMQDPSIEKVTETKLNGHNDAAFKSSESIRVDPITTNTLIKPLTADVLSEIQKTAEHKADDITNDHHLTQEKTADVMAAKDTDDMIDFLAKSANHLEHVKIENEDLHKEHVMEMAKEAEHLKPEQKDLLTENWDMKPKHSDDIQPLDNIPKPAGQAELTNFNKLGEHIDNVMLAKSADHISIQEHQKQQMISHEELSPAAMKATEEHLHHLQHVHNAHWGHESRHLDHLSSMKAAEEYDNEFRMAHGPAHRHGFTEHSMDHLRNSHMAEHTHIPSKMGVSHDFELANHGQAHHHHPARIQHKPMPYSQLHEMTGMDMHTNFHPSMRDAMEGFGSDHMFRWKPAEETSARGAYGSGLSSSISSAGAVGVFPNANVGGCGIPLLLSCRPSVVSGSLANTHSGSSYSAPSYRMEEDFGFHNKRDIKKTNDIRTTNSLRSPTIVKQKSSIALENKM